MTTLSSAREAALLATAELEIGPRPTHRSVGINHRFYDDVSNIND
jgi:hypothetical protein